MPDGAEARREQRGDASDGPTSRTLARRSSRAKSRSGCAYHGWNTSRDARSAHAAATISRERARGARQRPQTAVSTRRPARRRGAPRVNSRNQRGSKAQPRTPGRSAIPRPTNRPNGAEALRRRRSSVESRGRAPGQILPSSASTDREPRCRRSLDGVVGEPVRACRRRVVGVAVANRREIQARTPRIRLRIGEVGVVVQPLVDLDRERATERLPRARGPRPLRATCCRGRFRTGRSCPLVPTASKLR